jgi:hypothetical protein
VREYGANAPKHLRYTLTSRGFMHMPELDTHAYGALHLSESSSADAPYAWLRASAARTLKDPHDRVEVVLHVSLDDLAKFVQQCQFMLDHHYQVSPRTAEDVDND